MKKLLKNIVVIIAVIAFMLPAVPSVFAASSTIAFSANNVSVGQTVTVTMRFNFGEDTLAASCILNYDPAIFKTANYNGQCKVVMAPGTSTATETVVLTAIASGSCTVSITDAQYIPVVENKTISMSGASAKLTVLGNGGSSLSANNNLTSIKTASGTLTPKFSSNVTDYTVTVPNKFTDGTLTYGLADKKAKAAISGDIDLKVGRNIRKITVTAENGEQKVYTVTFIRLDASGEVPGEKTPEPSADTTVTVNGQKYSVASNFDTVKIPEFLKPAEIEIEQNKYSGFTDISGKYKYLYLYSGEDVNSGEFFEYDGKTFKELKYYSSPLLDYIILDLPETENVPSGYTVSEVTVNGFNTKGYVGSDYTDFVIIYAESANGTTGYYRYDKSEETIQRVPDFLTNNQNKDKNAGFTAAFSNANVKTKAVLVVAALAVVVLIALIVVCILLIAKKKHSENVEETTDDDLFLSEETPKTAEELISEAFDDE